MVQQTPIWAKYGFHSQAEFDYYSKITPKPIAQYERFYTSAAGNKAGQKWFLDDAKGMPGCHGPYANTELRLTGYTYDSEGFKALAAQTAKKAMFEQELSQQANNWAQQRIEKPPTVKGNIAYEGQDIVFTLTRAGDAKQAQTFWTELVFPDGPSQSREGKATFEDLLPYDLKGPSNALCPGAVKFEAGQTTAEVRIRTKIDNLTEEAERVTFRVSNGQTFNEGTSTIWSNKFDPLTGMTQVRGTQKSEFLSGSSGNDYFIGKGGKDTLTGGQGNDLFDVRDYNKQGSLDQAIIKAFEIGKDNLVLEFGNTYTTQLGSTAGLGTVVQVFDQSRGQNELIATLSGMSNTEMNQFALGSSTAIFTNAQVA